MSDERARRDDGDKRRSEERRGDTAIEHAWRAVGWSAFFAIGYLEVVREFQIPRYYPIGCWVIAEQRFVRGFLMTHGEALLQWLAKKFG